MSYKLALDFLKNQGKSDNIINLDLLEELLLKDKFGKYQSVKQKVQHKSKAHIRKFKLLYQELLNGQISDLDIEVYCQNFEPEQNIKYFRDYFHNTKETENYSSKGSSIELKAYGDSSKINREVISFTGNFRDNLLYSFTDKTSETLDFVSNDFSEIDYYNNDFGLVKLLVHNHILDVLSDNTLFKIALDNPDTFIYLYDAGIKDKFFKGNLETLAKKHIKIFNYLIENNLSNLISNETIKIIVEEKMTKIKNEVLKLKKLTTELAFLYDKEGFFYFKNYDIGSTYTQGLKTHNFKDDYSSYYKLNEIINKIKTTISYNSFYSDSNNLVGWEKSNIEKLTKVYLSSIEQEISSELNNILEISKQRIEQTTNENNKKSRTGCLTVIVIVLALALLFKYLTS
jgi:hypothetical protein